MTPEAAQAEMLDLKMQEREVQMTLDLKREKLQLAANQKQEAARSELVAVAQDMLQENGWDALLDVGAQNSNVLAFNKDTDVTQKVLEKADAEFAAAETKLASAGSTESKA